MATLTFKAVAPAIPTPAQWGSNVFVVQASYWMKDQSENPQVNIEGLPVDTPSGATRWQQYYPNIKDFTTDTIPPFEPLKDKDFISIKVVGITDNILINHPNPAFHRHLLTLGGQEVVPGMVIKKEDLANRELSFISCEQTSYAYRVINLKVLYNNGLGEFPIETLTEFTLFSIGKQSDTMQRFRFKDNANIDVNQPIKIITPLDLINLLDIEIGSIEDVWSDEYAYNFFVNTVGASKLYKVEFLDLDGCEAIEYFGKPIVKGQKIQIQAFQEGRVRIVKSKLEKTHNIHIALGHSFTGKFRIEENAI